MVIAHRVQNKIGNLAIGNLDGRSSEHNVDITFRIGYLDGYLILGGQGNILLTNYSSIE